MDASTKSPSLAKTAIRSAEGLDALLIRARSAYRAPGLQDLIAGVAAAPLASQPDAWMELVAPAARRPPALDRWLAALLAQARTNLHGLEAETPREPRLKALRAELKRRRLDGFVVPRADEHQGEYAPARSQRLGWLTGFTGSAGTAVILAREAAVFTDGRYTLQLRAEVDGKAYQYRSLPDETPADWIGEHLPEAGRLGYDPWLHTTPEIERLNAACRRRGGRLISVNENPLDAIWADQPPPPLSPAVPHPIAFAGKSAAKKRREVAESLRRADAGAAVLTAPDSIAWLLNLRGGDVPYTPLCLAFAVVFADASVDLYVDRRKLTPGLVRALGNGVRVHSPDAFGPGLDRLGADGKTVRVDPNGAAVWIVERLRRAAIHVDFGPDPCALPKAHKNGVEIAGTRAAHLRDGAALTTFLAWLEEAASGGELTELAAAHHLDELRARNAHFRGLSFPTISGAASNGAVVHYRVTPRTNRKLKPGDLFLIDSGAQYLDGTTDVTRTVAIGKPTVEMKDRFTRVLKGHIAVATTRFPAGTTGSHLDILARRALWEAGLDFMHGTGHGVGSYLGVHEGPQRISKAYSAVALEPGMIVSNEPGYYKAGAYGIRLENLVLVGPAEPAPGAERDMLALETLTLAPLDLACVEPKLLTTEEIAWLDAYHERVRTALSPLLGGNTRSWLEKATRRLGP